MVEKLNKLIYRFKGWLYYIKLTHKKRPKSDLGPHSLDFEVAHIFARHILYRTLRKMSDEIINDPVAVNTDEILTKTEKAIKALSAKNALWTKQSKRSVHGKSFDVDPTAEQNRLVIAIALTAIAIGMLTLGRQGLGTFIGKHSYTSGFINFFIPVPILSGALAFLYILATASTLKYGDRDFVGSFFLPKIHVRMIREKLYDWSVDIFWVSLGIDVLLAAWPLAYNISHSKIVAAVAAISLGPIFVLLVTIYNGFSIALYTRSEDALQNTDKEESGAR